MNPAVILVITLALVILLGGFYRDVMKGNRH